MRIITYPHPTLRYRSSPVKRVDAELRRLVDEMFELMHEAGGIGLAANQVDLPLRLFVGKLDAEGEEGPRLVFLNPVITRPKGFAEAEEGCLSLPQLVGDVVRPKKVHVHAYSLTGEEIHMDVDGLLGRMIQHEVDHLDGVLFIDRISDIARLDLQDELTAMEEEYSLSQGATEDAAAILARLREWEARYC